MQVNIPDVGHNSLRLAFFTIDVQAVTDLLFVYGTLRWASPAPVAMTLRQEGWLVGQAWAPGRLYRIADYPGFVPDTGGGHVQGDLIGLRDPDRMLALLDDYEECSPRFPEPREYRREILRVETSEGFRDAWTYIYARPTIELTPIEGGIFMPAATPPG